MSLSNVLTALGLKPKNLEEARNAIEPAKATLDSVNALFTSAGLNLETLLAAGPESLKAHLASLDNAAQVATLTEQLTAAKSELATLAENHEAATGRLATYGELFTTVGLTAAAAPDAPALKTACDSHVAKQVTLANAKIGHPPVQHLALEEHEKKTLDQAKADGIALAEYNTLVSAGDAKKAERLAYFKANAPAIERAMSRLRRGE